MNKRMMKAAVLAGPKQIEIKELPVPYRIQSPIRLQV